MIPYNYIAIDGNIGVGKTSLAAMLASDLEMRFFTERFERNLFLDKFYDDIEKYALAVELSFLSDRYEELLKCKQILDSGKRVITDYSLDKSYIFAQNSLSPEEFDLFKKYYQILTPNLPKPDLYVVLNSATIRLQYNIKKRGRNFEQNIPSSYLDSIQNYYDEYFGNIYSVPILMVDVNTTDFVENQEDYIKVRNLLNTKYPNGINKVIL